MIVEFRFGPFRPLLEDNDHHIDELGNEVEDEDQKRRAEDSVDDVLNLGGEKEDSQGRPYKKEWEDSLDKAKDDVRQLSSTRLIRTGERETPDEVAEQHVKDSCC